jgi:hypothetical protein
MMGKERMGRQLQTQYSIHLVRSSKGGSYYLGKEQQWSHKHTRQKEACEAGII